MLTFLNRAQDALDATRRLDFLGPLLLRLYLVPIFWMAGTHKLADMDATIAWFGNPDWGLGLPFPTLLAWLAALTETGGAVLLLFGLAVRWISVPLMVTMLVAMFTVHLRYGFSSIDTIGLRPDGPVFGPPGYEINLLYIGALVALAVAGPSAWSVDGWLRERRRKIASSPRCLRPTGPRSKPSSRRTSSSSTS